MPILVLLADDSPFVRKAIVGLLKTDPEIHVLSEASTFLQMTQAAKMLHPQVIVLDVYMPHENDATPPEIRESLADSKVLAMSFLTNDETKAIAESYGAIALLDKTKLAFELILAIKRCIET